MKPAARRLVAIRSLSLCRFVVASVLAVVVSAATASATESAVAAKPAAPECIVLADFSKSTPGQFPAGWKVRKDAAKEDYTVQEEGGSRFLHAHSRGLGQQAATQSEWNLDEYPVLRWRWRPVEFPKGGDERVSGRNDSVLAVYLLVPYSTIRGPRAVKYIWSEQAPVGTQLESNLGLTKVRVLRSGRSGAGSWSEERVNVRSDYLTAFGLSEAPVPGGIAVLTDSDDTGSSATGDYADFRACRQ